MTTYKRPEGWDSDDTGFKSNEDNYLIDWNQLTSLNINNIGKKYFMGSHRSWYNNTSGNFYFAMKAVNIEGILFIDSAIAGIDGTAYTLRHVGQDAGFRPVITLKNSIKVITGEGTQNTPYKLGI